MPDEHLIPLAENRLRVDAICADLIPTHNLTLLVRDHSFHTIPLMLQS